MAGSNEAPRDAALRPKNMFLPPQAVSGCEAGATTNIEIREPHKSGYQSETLGRTNAHHAYGKCTQYAFPPHYGVGVESGKCSIKL